MPRRHLFGAAAAPPLQARVFTPGGDLAYSSAGIVAFSGFTVVDFYRLRRADVQHVVPLAAGIFLDVVSGFRTRRRARERRLSASRRPDPASSPVSRPYWTPDPGAARRARDDSEAQVRVRARVIAACANVFARCAEFPGSPDTAHWSIADPAAEPNCPGAFARVADELTERLRFFLHVLALRPTTRKGTDD